MGVWMIALILIASLIAGVVIYIDVISDFIIDANFLHLHQCFCVPCCFHKIVLQIAEIG